MPWNFLPSFEFDYLSNQLFLNSVWSDKSLYLFMIQANKDGQALATWPQLFQNNLKILTIIPNNFLPLSSSFDVLVLLFVLLVCLHFLILREY